MRQSTIGSWIAIAIGAAYFLIPLIGTFEFSLRMRRGEYSFDAYRVVLADPNFQATFAYSTLVGLATILVGILLVVPTAYWVQLRLPQLRPLVEFVLKFVVDRTRPEIDPLGTFHGPSHPSGHPLAAASLWGQFPAVVALHFRSRVLWWGSVALSFTVVFLVAAARVYKGAHYITDVTASIAWAALYLAAVQGFFDRYHGTTNCQHPQHEAQTGHA